jgi:DNA-binding transcriptional ArsR family regulator
VDVKTELQRMSGLIDKLQGPVATPDEQLRVLDVEGEETDDVLDALSSETSRELYRALFEDPATPSEIAERIDTSVQNVNYHLTNLEDAGLVEAIDTRYSEKGNEMTVYGPATDPLVFVGNRDLRPRVQRSLADVVAGLGILGVAGLFVQWGAEQLFGAGSGAGTAVGPASASGSSGGTPDAISWLVFQVFEPGLLFFFGALFVIAVALYAVDQ